MSKLRICICIAADSEKVNPHLSITLKDMERMRGEGKAIAMDMNKDVVSFNGNQQDGLSPEYQRGMSLNKMYENGVRSSRKLTKAGRKFLHDAQNYQSQN